MEVVRSDVNDNPKAHKDQHDAASCQLPVRINFISSKKFLSIFNGNLILTWLISFYTRQDFIAGD